jgi:hypothetical protein
MNDIDKEEEARQRQLRYDQWKTNPFSIELFAQIRTLRSALKAATAMDTTTFNVGGILAREKAFGVQLAYEEIEDFIHNDLPLLEENRNKPTTSAK